MCKTRYEFAKEHAELLRACSVSGVRVEDWKNILIYEEVMRLRSDGLKMEYCVDYASDKFGISRTRVWAILRHLRTKV